MTEEAEEEWIDIESDEEIADEETVRIRKDITEVKQTVDGITTSIWTAKEKVMDKAAYDGDRYVSCTIPKVKDEIALSEARTLTTAYELALELQNMEK